MAEDPKEPEGPARPDALDDLLMQPRYFQNIEAFTEIRIEAYLAQAAILAVQFIGRGDADKGRRYFMGAALGVYDRISTRYADRSLDKNMARLRELRRARARAESANTETEKKEDEPPPGGDPPPESG